MALGFDPTGSGIDRMIAFPLLVANAVSFLGGGDLAPSLLARAAPVNLPVARASRGQPGDAVWRATRLTPEQGCVRLEDVELPGRYMIREAGRRRRGAAHLRRQRGRRRGIVDRPTSARDPVHRRAETLAATRPDAVGDLAVSGAAVALLLLSSSGGGRSDADGLLESLRKLDLTGQWIGRVWTRTCRRRSGRTRAARHGPISAVHV